MKILSIFLVLFLSAGAFANCNREVQFIGNIKNLKSLTKSSDEIKKYSFQLSIGRWFVPSIQCPMDENEFENAVVTIETLQQLSSGDEISGVLVYDEDEKKYCINQCKE
jgi:hypothetical protein